MYIVLLLARLSLPFQSFFFPPLSLFLKSNFELILKIMDDSTSDCQLNQGEVDYEFQSNEVPEVGMTFTTLEDARKFYRDYTKTAGFSTRVQSTNRKGNEIRIS
ncbi:hypothetical protein Ahy_B10g103245 [Arachis hypogaea]|uniref:FAR1 domain-containing protein n=1 Tax=Arachis hypogaea TaxID=3818 RepID=A0A444X3P0_ARAHY|nr:hypothetical protein Ahy_B10g103245 [Arachis hypogaea]